MTNRRISVRPGAVLCLLGSTLLACNSAPPACPGVDGSFQALYQPRSGNCGPISSAHLVKVEDNITIEKYANVDVETETIVKGCTVYMKQIERNKQTGAVQSQVQGSTLEVQDENQLNGMVTLTRWDVATGAIMCSGEYNLLLTKNTATLGGASM
jgi:hypothetical protein